MAGGGLRREGSDESKVAQFCTIFGASLPGVRFRPVVILVPLVPVEVAWRIHEVPRHVWILLGEQFLHLLHSPAHEADVVLVAPEVRAAIIAAVVVAGIGGLELRKGQFTSHFVAPSTVLLARDVACTSTGKGDGIPNTTRGGYIARGKGVLIHEAVAPHEVAVLVELKGTISLPCALVAFEASARALALVVSISNSKVHALSVERGRSSRSYLESDDFLDAESARTSYSVGVVGHDFVGQIPKHPVHVCHILLAHRVLVQNAICDGPIHVKLVCRGWGFVVGDPVPSIPEVKIGGIVPGSLGAVGKSHIRAQPTLAVAGLVAQDEAVTSRFAIASSLAIFRRACLHCVRLSGQLLR
mmetsp:Transcript_90512/g.198286  ORF Transcript_90512/g.198286 Transcript_90512/m.198286 type:complete len:357 (+) Transcript_90512:2-1072(+)